jgi:hypothetical protein
VVRRARADRTETHYSYPTSGTRSCALLD